MVLWKALCRTHELLVVNSNVHGLCYISSKNHKAVRVMWIMVMLVSLGGSFFLSQALWFRFIANPTRVTIPSQTSPTELIPFPAITICSPNIMKQQHVDKFIKSLTDLPNVTTDDLRQAIRQLNSYFNPSYITDIKTFTQLYGIIRNNRYMVSQVMTLLPQKCGDFFVKCRWEGKFVNCSEIFLPAYTLYGKCCSFNFKHAFWRTHYKPLHTKYFGPHMGLSLLLDTEADNAMVFEHGGSSLVMVHKSEDYPAYLGDYRFAKSGHETFFSLDGFSIKVASDVAELEHKDRECLFRHERKLHFFQEYEERNCQIECLMNASIKMCGCLPFFFPRRGFHNECLPVDVPCLYGRIREFLTDNEKHSLECQCDRLCDTTLYRVHSDMGKLDATAFANSNDFYAGVNLTSDKSVVHIFFKKQTLSVLRQDTIIPWWNLISNLGGVFCLFLGCSIVSILEIVYIFGIKFISILREEKKKKNSGKRRARSKKQKGIEKPFYW